MCACACVVLAPINLELAAGRLSRSCIGCSAERAECPPWSPRCHLEAIEMRSSSKFGRSIVKWVANWVNRLRLVGVPWIAINRSP